MQKIDFPVELLVRDHVSENYVIFAHVLTSKFEMNEIYIIASGDASPRLGGQLGP